MKSGDCRNFTIIELLVVVSVIAILASILLPGLLSAKEMARRISCASNLKQVGMAFECYATDYNGYIPAANTSNANMLGSYYQLEDWVYALWPYGVGPYKYHPCAIYDVSFKRSIFFCPSAPVRTNFADVSVTSTIGPFIRYGINWIILGEQTGTTGGNELMKVPFQASLAKSPSRNALSGEEFKTDLCYGYSYYPDNGSTGEGLISHNLGTNFLFFDKHVEWRKFPGQLPPNTYSNADYKVFWRGF